MPREAKFKMGDNVTARYGKNVIRSAEIMAYNRNSNYYWLKINEEFMYQLEVMTQNISKMITEEQYNKDFKYTQNKIKSKLGRK